MQTVLITGASKGIGKASARAFAKAGWDLLLVARSENDLKSLAKELESKQHNPRRITGLYVQDIFKDYIEDTILNDTEINFRNRKKLFHCIGDNFERIFGFKHKGMRDTLSGTESGFTQWI